MIPPLTEPAPAPVPEPVIVPVPPRPALPRPEPVDGEACPKAHFQTFAASIRLPHRCVKCTGEFEAGTRRAA